MQRLAQGAMKQQSGGFRSFGRNTPALSSAFLCGAEIEKQGRLATLAVPDRPAKKGHKPQMMISLICAACVGLPPMVRWNRAIRMVKRMHGRAVPLQARRTA